MELKKAIILDDGSKVESLDFSWDSLSYADLYTARKIKLLVTRGQAEPSISPKLDTELRIGISWVAAMKHDSRLAVNDVLKISLSDCLELSDICLDEYLI